MNTLGLIDHPYDGSAEQPRDVRDVAEVHVQRLRIAYALAAAGLVAAADLPPRSRAAAGRP